MFDLIINDDSDRELLIQLDSADRDALIMKRIHAMALDLAKLNVAVTRSTLASEAVLVALAAAQPDPAVELAVQASLDAAASLLDAESVKVEAVLPPPDPPPTPAA